MEAQTDNIESMKVEALKICQDFLGEPWTEISISEFQFSAVSGGLSNSLYHCALPDNAVIKNSKVPRQVLLRIYGIVQEDEGVVVKEAATFMLLAERKLGPKLFGVFPHGRLEEFIPSRTLKTADYRLMYKDIAREMAKIHALDVPVRKTYDFWMRHMKKFLKDCENVIAEKSKGPFELGDWYREETKWLYEEIKKTKSPLVYCHNDLQGGNILLRQDIPSKENYKLMLIDFEFGAYNYRGFDLANQFVEWCFDYNTEEYPHYVVNFDQFPSKQEQVLFATAYLNQLVEDQVIPVSAVEDEIKSIVDEVDVFAMAAHLLWSLWSIKMSFLSIGDFAHGEHGNTRRFAYKMIKERYLSRGLCNGDPKEIHSSSQ